MAFDESLAERIRQALARKDIEEKKLFGGVENDDQLNAWIQRAVKFVGTWPGKS